MFGTLHGPESMADCCAFKHDQSVERTIRVWDVVFCSYLGLIILIPRNSKVYVEGNVHGCSILLKYNDQLEALSASERMQTF